MKSNPFNNLPKINKIDAINILRRPISEVKLLADYYKAVFHLANFPCEESEMVLLDFIKHDSENLSLQKKIQNIQIKLKNSLPTIPSTLKEELDCNIFLRAKDVKTFSKLRDLKDNF